MLRVLHCIMSMTFFDTPYVIMFKCTENRFVNSGHLWALADVSPIDIALLFGTRRNCRLLQ